MSYPIHPIQQTHLQLIQPVNIKIFIVHKRNGLHVL